MIHVVHFDNWTFLPFISQRVPGYAIRGQLNFNWPLSTLFERLTPKFRENGISLDNREFHMLTQFRRRAHNIIDKPPDYDELLEWLSIIQHYGGPTRLLDFTKSFYVGLFFACEGATEDSAVWMIDYFDIQNRRLGNHGSDTVETRRTAMLDKARNYVGVSTSESGLLPVEPERLNERMSIQQGISLFPINIDKTFMENLQIEYGWDSIE